MKKSRKSGSAYKNEEKEQQELIDYLCDIIQKEAYICWNLYKMQYMDQFR